MGVLNNDRRIRDLFDAVKEILSARPLPKITTQPPTDTAAQSVTIIINILGAQYTLQKLDAEGNWVNVTTSTSNTTNITVSLSGITSASRCRVQIVPYGTTRTAMLVSNEFNVIRASTQSVSTSKPNISEKLESEEI